MWSRVLVVFCIHATSKSSSPVSQKQWRTDPILKPRGHAHVPMVFWLFFVNLEVFLLQFGWVSVRKSSKHANSEFRSNRKPANHKNTIGKYISLKMRFVSYCGTGFLQRADVPEKMFVILVVLSIRTFLTQHSISGTKLLRVVQEDLVV